MFHRLNSTGKLIMLAEVGVENPDTLLQHLHLGERAVPEGQVSLIQPPLCPATLL